MSEHWVPAVHQDYERDSGGWLLSEKEQNAVVAVAVTSSRSEHICSGVVVSLNRVLTASHCVPEPLLPIEIRVGSDLVFPVARVDAFVLAREIRLDLALLGIVGYFEHSVAPIAYANGLSVSFTDSTDTIAAVAGFGIHGGVEGVPEHRRFTLTPITSAQSDSVIVGEQGREGACRGDSGGPLLGRAANGVPIVLGILTAGSASCTGIDLFTRVDVASAWLRKYICEAPASPDGGNCERIAD